MSLNPSLLVLEDGLVIHADSVGASGEVSGEVVFNTSMMGYQEILTDPSYRGQILLMTYPLMGNYGINPQDMQSDRIQVRAMLMKECSPFYSHYNATQSLSDFLKSQNVMGLQGLDTRKLTRHLREKGAMRGILSTEDLNSKSLLEKLRKVPPLKKQSLVAEVTTEKRYRISAKKDRRFTISLLDCGVKRSIIDLLCEHNCDVEVFPAHSSTKEILSNNCDGILVSNGPGDPSSIPNIVKTVRELLGKKPIFGICLGHQLISLALGASTYKLKFGHRGANHPVKNVLNNRVSISSQNHGFCVHSKNFSDSSVILSDWNLNDHTVAGISHKTWPILSVQYHPEAAPGPKENIVLFQKFIQMITSYKQGTS